MFGLRNSKQCDSRKVQWYRLGREYEETPDYKKHVNAFGIALKKTVLRLEDSHSEIIK